MSETKTVNTVELYAGTLLLDNSDRVYLIKEADRNRISKGRWNLPGGAVKPREDLITAAKRATEEESGFDVVIKTLIGVYKCTKDDKEWIYVVFEAKTNGEKKSKVSKTVTTGKWFERSEIAQMTSEELVHPDMQLVYTLAVDGCGIPSEAVKYINYNKQ